MLYTRYWAILKPFIHSLYTFIHQTYTLYMSHTRYWGHIQPLIPSLYSFIHHTFTLAMSYMRYWPIFNHWYIAYTLLYMRHTNCTCSIRGIGPYSTIDAKLVHFYTSHIHPTHVVYTVLGYIQPVIHTLYTFIHQTYTLHMSHTRYWAIFNRWYIPSTLLYIRHSTCTCHIRSIG